MKVETTKIGKIVKEEWKNRIEENLGVLRKLYFNHTCFSEEKYRLVLILMLFACLVMSKTKGKYF